MNLFSPFGRQLFGRISVQRLETINCYIRFSSQYKIAASTIQPSEYRFSSPNGNLSDQQRQFYEKNGFLIVRKLVKPEILEHLANRFRDICMGKVKVSGLTIMRDVAIAKSEFTVGEKAVTRIQDFTSDNELFKYCCLPELVKYVENFTGPNIMVMHTMMLNKPSDPGGQSSRHPLHQDLHFFPFRPANRIVCSWTAMETVNRQNGCLVVLPGTHQGELEVHEYPHWEGGVNKMYHGIQKFDPKKARTYLEMEAGDTVFFHPLLIHGSGRNKTSGFRKAISCHFADSTCEYIECDNTSQDDISKEYTDVYRRKTGDKDIRFQDVWRERSRLVQGERINL